MTEETIDFGYFKLTVNIDDWGGRSYKDPNVWANLVCPIQKEIIQKFKPSIFLDIGANYGFSSLVHLSQNPNCFIIAVEPSPILNTFIIKNFEQNNFKHYQLVKAICADRESSDEKFCLNPYSSQDNRVIGMKGWKSISVSSTTVNSLLKNAHSKDFVYIKIDVQGFEEKVFLGSEYFLLHNSNWIVKTEFAPKWMVSQGTNPILFLEYLIEKYRVIEMPKRTRYKGNSLKILNENPLFKTDCASFVDYIQSLAYGDGWCDLLIFPNVVQSKLLNHLNNNTIIF